jgi:hypothetical protein
MRDRVLERDVDIVQRQPRLHPWRHDGGFLHGQENGAAAFLRSHRQIFDRLPMAPLQDGLLVDPISLREARDRSLRSLQLASNGVRGLGAPVQNLSRKVLCCDDVKSTPSHAGTKHLITFRQNWGCSLAGALMYSGQSTSIEARMPS